MKKEIFTEISIPSNSEKIWKILTDFESYQNWNPFIQKIKGECKLGSTLQITLRKPSSGKLYTFTATITACEKNRLLQWQGTFIGLSWLFCGVHRFELKSTSNERTKFIHKEHFSGILSSRILSGIYSDTKLGFEAMNHALKDKVLTVVLGKGKQNHA